MEKNIKQEKEGLDVKKFWGPNSLGRQENCTSCCTISKTATDIKCCLILIAKI